MAGYVLDTSAILTVLREEDGAQQVVALLESSAEPRNAASHRILIPFLVLMEVEHTLLRHGPAARVDMALLLVEQWPATFVESDVAWRHEAARIKAANGLSVADAWIAALAKLREAILVHKDPEFDGVQGLDVLRLPYKPAG
ncbi:MAG: PIN domain-containing protein [Chloroflexota bacterium]|nr:PIN domain-containing protein [Chloroflexota bacterium]